MLEQFKNFDAKHFGKTFNLNKYYNGNINGFDIMTMQSYEDANKLIKELKNTVDTLIGLQKQNINLEYNDEHLLESDKNRVKIEIKNYISQKLKGIGCM